MHLFAPSRSPPHPLLFLPAPTSVTDPTSFPLLSAISLDARCQAFLPMDTGCPWARQFCFLVSDPCRPSDRSHSVNHHHRCAHLHTSLSMTFSPGHTHFLRKMILITPQGFFRCQGSFSEHTCVAGSELNSFSTTVEFRRSSGGPGEERHLPGTGHVFRCYQLSAHEGRAPETFVEGVPGTFDPSSFCRLFRRSLMGKRAASVGEARCRERMDGSGPTGAIRNYFLGQKRKGLKVLNPPHEE